MNVSFRWLAEFFPAGTLEALGPDEVARRLTLQGFAVDEVRPAFETFSGVVVGKVQAARPHPDADRLTLCTVADGAGERQVVCGAPNVEVGAFYGYAREGARLPAGREIRRARIRGVESQGMLCSAPELGLDALGGADGIWRVDGAGDPDLGRDFREALGLDDFLLVVDVPSNRGDALSHRGIARELQWITGAGSALPSVSLVETDPPQPPESARVTVEDDDGCPLYLGRCLAGIEVGPSPAWLQVRLLALGFKPINNIVDATQVVMLECGQPLHVFDFDRLAGGQIVVRRARPGERMQTLDGRERQLDSEMTMIADARAAIAIGGAMGGLDSEVTDATRTVFLEAAHFDPSRVARTARRLGITSEAATRFSRGVDPGIAAWALDRATTLIVTHGGGRAGGRVEVDRRTEHDGPSVTLRLPRLTAMIGREIPAVQAERALESLGFRVERNGATLQAWVPSWRFDVSQEVDVIEEIARLTGYDQVPLMPLPAPAVTPPVGSDAALTARLAAAARGAGFDEARTPSFVGEDALGPEAPVDNLVEIRNPISHAERFLRPFLFTTLGGAVVHNLNRGAERVKLFEIGHAFQPAPERNAPFESRHLALAAAGARAPVDWSHADAPTYDFYDLKGDLTEILWSATGIEAAFEPGERPYLHPGRQAEILAPGGEPLGFLGELHPRVAEAWGAAARVHVAECDLAALAGSGRRDIRMAEIPREPAVRRDLAVVVPDGHAAADVLAVATDAKVEDLQQVEVFDRYAGPPVPPEHHSLGIRLIFQAGRTLTDAETDARVAHLVGRLEAAGYAIR